MDDGCIKQKTNVLTKRTICWIYKWVWFTFVTHNLHECRFCHAEFKQNSHAPSRRIHAEITRSISQNSLRIHTLHHAEFTLHFADLTLNSHAPFRRIHAVYSCRIHTPIHAVFSYIALRARELELQAKTVARVNEGGLTFLWGFN